MQRSLLPCNGAYSLMQRESLPLPCNMQRSLLPCSGVSPPCHEVPSHATEFAPMQRSSLPHAAGVSSSSMQRGLLLPRDGVISLMQQRSHFLPGSGGPPSYATGALCSHATKLPPMQRSLMLPCHGGPSSHPTEPCSPMQPGSMLPCNERSLTLSQDGGRRT